MKITKKLAIKILKYLAENKDFYFPLTITCKEFGKTDNLSEIGPEKWKTFERSNKYQTFELQENLQNLYKETVALMAKGFIEKITGESLEKHIAELAKNYRKEWKEELWESEDSEEFGFNEFIGGKAEAYEDCLEIIRKYGIINVK